MSKTAQVTVLYPRKDGAKFDMDYYLATHMPLVSKHWTKYGLKSYSVTQLSPDAPYSVQAAMEWENIGAFQKAGQGPEAKEIFADVANFSSETPILCAGEVVGSG